MRMYGTNVQDAWDEARIIAEILGGDREQFALLVKRYERLVLSITLRAMKDRSAAEDAAQDTFVKAYVHLDAYNPEYRFSTWISRIAQNTCTDMFRKSREYAGLEEAEEMADPGPSPEEALLEREQAKSLSAAVSSLEEMYREPLMMYHASGMQYDEIAERLGIPMSRVKNRIFRARRMLRVRIAGQATEPGL
jgi:RNA polymerase sigma-70 factor (ECF subfamily)